MTAGDFLCKKIKNAKKRIKKEFTKKININIMLALDICVKSV